MSTDDEINALETIVEAMSGLDDRQRWRVLVYLNARYQPRQVSLRAERMVLLADEMSRRD